MRWQQNCALRASRRQSTIIRLHQQTAYRHYPVAGNGLPASERIAGEVLSLPMHPYLDDEVQDRIVAETVAALGS
jgi:dTDP-4-amino-4,6-dideoxygalactose transaminase